MENTTVIDDLLKRARAAQEQVENYTQEQIDEVCLAVGWEVYKDENIEQCAKLAVEETGMGIYEHKLTKHKVKVLGVCKDIKDGKSVGLVEYDEKKQIAKYAKPVGVIGALTPVTNPTATLASNAVSILKGRNAVIFAPHPKAKKSCALTCNLMRQGLKKVGAPEDMILWIEEPSVALSQELMSKVDLALATGGAAMVKSAYSSGTPAYGVGAGNPVIIVAEDADIEDAAQKIFVSKTFDNATSCSSDNSIVIQNAVFDKMVAAFEKRGGYMCNDEEKQKLHDWVWIPSKKTGKLALNPAIIAVSVEKIAKGAGLDVPADTTMLMVTEDKPGENKWSGEKLSPVMTLWRYDEFAQAMDMLTKIHAYAGVGHSCGIHTFKKEYIEQLGENIKVSRIMVRQAHAPSCGGNFHNGMPSTVTLGCGTWGGNITNDNISFKHFINLTWVSEPFAPVKPTEEDIWAELWAKCGK